MAKGKRHRLQGVSKPGPRDGIGAALRHAFPILPEDDDEEVGRMHELIERLRAIELRGSKGGKDGPS